MAMVSAHAHARWAPFLPRFRQVPAPRASILHGSTSQCCKARGLNCTASANLRASIERRSRTVRVNLKLFHWRCVGSHTQGCAPHRPSGVCSFAVRRCLEAPVVRALLVMRAAEVGERGVCLHASDEGFTPHPWRPSCPWRPAPSWLRPFQRQQRPSPPWPCPAQRQQQPTWCRRSRCPTEPRP